MNKLLFLIFLVACQNLGKKVDQNFLQGNEYARDGLFREAIAAYKAVIKKHNDNLSAHRNLGITLVRVGNYRDAIAHFKLSLAAYEDDYATSFYLAQAYRGIEKYADAIYYYERALRLKPHDPPCLRALAWTYYNTRYFSEALKLCEELRHIDPKDHETNIIYVRVLLKLREHDKAWAALAKAKPGQDSQKLAQIQALKAEVSYARGNFKKASKLFSEAIKMQPLQASALLGLGKCELKSQNQSQAIKLIETALRIRPELVEGYYYLAQAYEVFDAKKSLELYREFKKRVATDPEYVSTLPALSKKIADLGATP